MTPGFYRWLGEQPSWLQPWIVVVLLVAAGWVVVALALWVVRL